MIGIANSTSFINRVSMLLNSSIRGGKSCSTRFKIIGMSMSTKLPNASANTCTICMTAGITVSTTFIIPSSKGGKTSFINVSNRSLTCCINGPPPDINAIANTDSPTKNKLIPLNRLLMDFIIPPNILPTTPCFLSSPLAFGSFWPSSLEFLSNDSSQHAQLSVQCAPQYFQLAL